MADASKKINYAFGVFDQNVAILESNTLTEMLTVEECKFCVRPM